MGAARPLSGLQQVVLLLAATHVILGLYAFGIVLPQIALSFRDTPHIELLGQLLGGVVGLSFAIASPVMGTLVRRLGYRLVYLWSSIGVAVVGASTALFHDIYLILLFRLLLGVPVAGALVASLAGLSTLPAAGRARLFGFHTALGGAMGLASYVVIARLAALGWRWPFAVYLVGLALVPLILTLPAGRGAAAIGHVRAVPADPGAAAVPLRLGPVLFATALFLGMAGVLPVQFMPFYLADLGVHDPRQVALPLMAGTVFAIPAAASYGWLAARLGVLGTFALLSGFIAVGCALAGTSGGVPGVAAATALLSIGLALGAPNVNAAAVLSGPDPERAVGLVTGVYYGAQAVLPFASQALRQAAGPAAVFLAFAAAGAASGLGFFLTALVKRPRPVGAEAIRQADTEAVLTPVAPPLPS